MKTFRFTILVVLVVLGLGACAPDASDLALPADDGFQPGDSSSAAGDDLASFADPELYDVSQEEQAIELVAQQLAKPPVSWDAEFGVYSWDSESIVTGWFLRVLLEDGVVEWWFVQGDTGEATLKERHDPPSLPKATYANQKAPFFSGERWQCSQGNNDTPTHACPGQMCYAWDFVKCDGSGYCNSSLTCGEPVVAPWSAKVRVVSYGNNGGWGNYVIVEYYKGGDPSSGSSGYFGRLAHLNEIWVVGGQNIDGSQTIGRAGGTGGWPCHIHYQTENANGQSVPSTFADVGAPSYLGKYTSGNDYKIYKEWQVRGGAAGAGNPTTTYATRVTATGFSRTYSGGPNTCNAQATVYYEALGYSGGYQNTWSAWIVQCGFRSTYFNMGGPNSWIGYPTGRENSTGYGSCQTFRNGRMKYTRSTGKIDVAAGTCP